MKFKIEWIDRNREPQCAPNPRYPHGIDIEPPFEIWPYCKTDLPYPAKRCGLYIVECETCGIRVGITTAGRPDDPRSIKIECLKPKVTQ